MSGIFKASVLRKWIIPGFLFLGAFILISYGCGGGGGGGSSIVLPPHATTGIISGKVLSDGSVVLTNLTSSVEPASSSNEIPAQDSLRGNVAVQNAEIWIEDMSEIRTRSSANGEFVLENVPFGNRRVVAKLESALKIYLVRSQPIAISETIPAGNAGELTIIEATNRVQGILKDAEDSPIQNATLNLWGMTFFTDSEGKFVTPPLPPQEATGEIKVVGVPSGIQTRTITVPFNTGFVPEIEVTLAPIDQARNAPVAFLSPSVVEISPNQQIQLYADAQDADESSRENLDIEWSATDGLLATTTNRWIANWTAPDSQTTATATITVTDSTGLKGIARLPLKVGVGDEPGNQRPVISNIRVSGSSGNISLTYKLVDADDDPASIKVFYSLDGGENFSQTTSLIGSTTEILPGDNVLITWQSNADFNTEESNVVVKITPSDQGGEGTGDQTSAFTVNNADENAVPVIADVTVTGDSGDVTITYKLADADNDSCSIYAYFSIDGGNSFSLTQNLTGSTTAVLPGDNLTLTWNSVADVPGNQSNVMLRLVPNDGMATGTAGLTSAFSLANNSLPSVANVVTSGNSGDILIGFDLSDPESDPCGITVDFSIDNGATYVQTTNLTGTVSGIEPGEGKTISWNSAADINGNQSTVKVRITPYDVVGTGSASVSETFTVSNNNLPVVSAVTATGASGSIQLSYTLADPNNDLCSITVFYSIDGGSNYTQATDLTGTTTGLTPGSNKTVTWNSLADVNSNQSNVKIKIIPNDGTSNGTPGESAAFSVLNNTPPVVANVSTTGSVGPIQIQFDISDENGHACSISLFYSTDGGSNYTQTTNLTGTTTEIQPGTGKTLTWNSAADINSLQNNVKIKIVPNDGMVDGTAGESAAFTVNNNDVPVITNVATTGNSGNIVITYDLTEPNNDVCNISVFFSTDNGETYTQTTNLTGATTGVVPGAGKTLTWNSSTDILANVANAKIKVVADDGQGEGVPGESPAFPINNNQAPVVSSVTASGNTGDINITFTLTDGNNDPCSISVFYSVDGGVNYVQTGNLIGSTTEILPGTNRSIIWNSASDIPGNQSNVKVKILPNDGSSNGVEGETAGSFSINNNNLPVVSNVAASGSTGNITITYDLSDANGDNCSINLFYSLDDGVSYSQIQSQNISGTTSSIPPGTGKTVTWNSSLDVSGNQSSVKVKVIPVDPTGTGSAGESNTFSINNNNSPVISSVTTSGNTGDIQITYNLEDTESNDCSVSLAYSIDGGSTYTTTTNVSGTTSGI